MAGLTAPEEHETTIQIRSSAVDRTELLTTRVH
jgi:hypothetical protein